MYLVYKHTSPSGKSYIGITNDYDRRSAEHQRHDWCPAFHAAIKKYGWNNFLHEVLYTDISEAEAITLEVELIRSHNTKYPHGYNLTSGGEGTVGHERGEEWYAKMQAIADTKRGVARTEEVKRKISESKLGHTTSKETRDKLAKTYVMTSPSGEVITFHNMSAFCRDHNLFVGAMTEVANGKRKSYKGWTL